MSVSNARRGIARDQQIVGRHVKVLDAARGEVIRNGGDRRTRGIEIARRLFGRQEMPEHRIAGRRLALEERIDRGAIVHAKADDEAQRLQVGNATEVDAAARQGERAGHRRGAGRDVWTDVRGLRRGRERGNTSQCRCGTEK
jgi:hypothetical protein